MFTELGTVTVDTKSNFDPGPFADEETKPTPSWSGNPLTL